MPSAHLVVSAAPLAGEGGRRGGGRVVAVGAAGVCVSSQTKHSH